METNQAPTPTHVFDLNALLTAALMQAVNQATAPLIARIALLEEAMRHVPDVDRMMEIADDAARMVMAEHNEGYDHDDYDRLANDLDDKINDAVGDAVRDLSFTVTVD
jgi:hypothetical protein